MRIIAGEFRGRRLRPPPGRRVRPTTDRVREAWFSIVGEAVVGAEVLDLFAGSGALGLEALSRGAAHVTFVELAAPSLAALRANVAELGVEDHASIRRGDALRFVTDLPRAAYGLAFADPPYTSNQAELLCERWLETPFARILGVEHPARVTLTAASDRRKYGSTALTFLRLP